MRKIILNSDSFVFILTSQISYYMNMEVINTLYISNNQRWQSYSYQTIHNYQLKKKS